eukprot:TRINITY_DN3057_c0_g1_i3.p1 TRINITY_DN3057_c0_g1~~TRINITY_DN3057_c0_g1_i3.p1  ORF type:complete len:108 (-),score=28.24 TRINITY_DN3057_c0_g1_i3:131-454(-)
MEQRLPSTTTDANMGNTFGTMYSLDPNRQEHCLNQAVRDGAEAAFYTTCAVIPATFAAYRYNNWYRNTCGISFKAVIPMAPIVGAFMIITEKSLVACNRDRETMRRR